MLLNETFSVFNNLFVLLLTSWNDEAVIPPILHIFHVKLAVCPFASSCTAFISSGVGSNMSSKLMFSIGFFKSKYRLMECAMLVNHRNPLKNVEPWVFQILRPCHVGHKFRHIIPWIPFQRYCVCVKAFKRPLLANEKSFTNNHKRNKWCLNLLVSYQNNWRSVFLQQEKQLNRKSLSKVPSQREIYRNQSLLNIRSAICRAKLSLLTAVIELHETLLQ